MPRPILSTGARSNIDFKPALLRILRSGIQNSIEILFFDVVRVNQN